MNLSSLLNRQVLLESSQQDYMALAERYVGGDHSVAPELEKMVEAAAHQAGFKVGPVYHGTKASFRAFDPKTIKSFNEGVGFYFTDDKTVASGYGGAKSFYLKLNNPIKYGDKGFSKPILKKIVEVLAKLQADDTGEDIADGFLSNYGDVRDIGLAKAVKEAVESLARNDTVVDQLGDLYNSGVPHKLIATTINQVVKRDGFVSGGYSGAGAGGGTIYVAWHPNQIKSADLVTLYPDGSIVPLSKRFSNSEDLNESAKLELFDNPEQLNESILLEVIKITPQDQAKYAHYIKMWDAKKYREWFGDEERVYLPMPREKAHTPQPLIHALEKIGYTVTDYAQGLARKDGKKQDEKIGRVLLKYKDTIPNYEALTDILAQDPNRGGKNAALAIAISRHPLDLAKMSEDRHWQETSCMRFSNQKSEFICADIEEGSLIAYLIKEEDKEIEHPLGRLLLKPYINRDDPKDIILVNTRMTYGKIPDQAKFHSVVDSWLESVQGKAKGIYEINPNLYHDIPNMGMGEGEGKDEILFLNIDPNDTSKLEEMDEDEAYSFMEGNDWKILPDILVKKVVKSPMNAKRFAVNSPKIPDIFWGAVLGKSDNLYTLSGIVVHMLSKGKNEIPESVIRRLSSASNQAYHVVRDVVRNNHLARIPSTLMNAANHYASHNGLPSL